MMSQPLSSIPVGTRVKLNAIHGGRLLTRRLLSLGISLGSEFEVVNHRGLGVVLAREGNRVALGGGIAEKLSVEPID
ncbi:MAG: FeoA domain-containing protein [Chromatiales bacterium]